MLAAALLVGGGGCAQLQQTRGQCGCNVSTVSEFGLGCALDRLCECEPLKGCGQPVEIDRGTACITRGTEPVESEACPPASPASCPQVAKKRLKRKWRPGCNVKPSPPPIAYRPPVPPTFLPVPTQPIFSTVNMAAPEPMRGVVEVDFGR